MISYINEKSHSTISVGQRMERDPEKTISKTAKGVLDKHYKDIYDMYEYTCSVNSRQISIQDKAVMSLLKAKVVIVSVMMAIIAVELLLVHMFFM